MIYSIGGDSLLAIQWTLINEYFGIENIGLSLGLISISITLGGCSNAFFSSYLVRKGGVNLAFFITALICVFSFCINSSIRKMDHKVMLEIK